ncbi:MAG: GNAT family N-acetyltransferase [Bryobacterales bacterium]|nr:GNAT family N-acetyltransferase [Bryobacterales bacterium]
MNDLAVRQGRVEDAETLAHFNELMAWETERLKLDPQRIRAGVRQVLAQPAKGFYLVAELDGTIAGQLMVTYEWSDWRNGNFWWIQSVYVDAKFRRAGVFRALYAEIERLAKLDTSVCGIRLYVEQDNEKAQHTYQALGMVSTPYRILEVDYVIRRAGPHGS